MTYRKLIYTLLLLATTVQAHAADADSILVEHLGAWQSLDGEARNNPALHGQAFASSFSQLFLKADYQRQSEAFEEEEGDGFFRPAVDIETFLRLSDKTAVWGSAGYMNGQQRHVRWNSTTDYELLKPYILADSVGGNVSQERYVFSGGYATKLEQWLLGAEMLFRAEHEYRDTDPRMRGIVNDLTIRTGAAYTLWDYHWGLSLEGNIYKQTNSMVFYRELGVIPEYQMTGLGTEYARFSGDKRSLYFKGRKVLLLLDAVPTDHQGVYGHLKLGESCYRRVLADLNSMPLTDLYSNLFGAILGWKGNRWATHADFLYTSRNGDEHIGGTAVATYFPVIGKRTMYKNNLMDASLSVLYRQQSIFCLQLKGGYLMNHEHYVYPERRMEYSRYYGEFSGESFLSPMKRLTLQCNLNLAYYANADKRIVMPYGEMQPSFMKKIDRQYEFAKASYGKVALQVRGDYRLRKSYALFASVGSGFVHCSAGEHQLTANVSAGVTF